MLGWGRGAEGAEGAGAALGEQLGGTGSTGVEVTGLGLEEGCGEGLRVQERLVVVITVLD